MVGGKHRRDHERKGTSHPGGNPKPAGERAGGNHRRAAGKRVPAGQLRRDDGGGVPGRDAAAVRGHRAGHSGVRSPSDPHGRRPCQLGPLIITGWRLMTFGRRSFGIIGRVPRQPAGSSNNSAMRRRKSKRPPSPTPSSPTTSAGSYSPITPMS